MTFGQIAYEAYGHHRSWKVFSGAPMPTWSDCSPDIREAWEVAGRAAAKWMLERIVDSFVPDLPIPPKDAGGPSSTSK